MKRRKFAGIVAAGVAGLALPTGTGWALVQPSLQAPDLLHILGSPQRVREIGLGYRSLFPAEDNPQALKAILAEPESAKEQVHRDFAQGRTVLVKGWVLSVTEARQCALYSFVS